MNITTLAASGSELEQRLLDKPEDWSPKELAVTRGIELDKLARAQEEQSNSVLETLTRIGQELVARGGLELTVSLRPGQQQDEPIDVTPSPDEAACVSGRKTGP